MIYQILIVLALVLLIYSLRISWKKKEFTLIGPPLAGKTLLLYSLQQRLKSSGGELKGTQDGAGREENAQERKVLLVHTLKQTKYEFKDFTIYDTPGLILGRFETKFIGKLIYLQRQPLTVEEKEHYYPIISNGIHCLLFNGTRLEGGRLSELTDKSLIGKVEELQKDIQEVVPFDGFNDNLLVYEINPLDGVLPFLQ